MPLVTVVRSLVGTTVELPEGIFIRPWHFVELGELSDRMRGALRVLMASRVVQIGQLRDGAPLSTVDLSKPDTSPPLVGQPVA